MILLEHRIDHVVPDSVKVHALTLEGKSCSKGFLGKRVAAWRLRSLLKKLGVDKPFDLHVSTLPSADSVFAMRYQHRGSFAMATTSSAKGNVDTCMSNGLSTPSFLSNDRNRHAATLLPRNPLLQVFPAKVNECTFTEPGTA